MNNRIRGFALTSVFTLASLIGTFAVTAVPLQPTQDKIEVTTNEGAAIKSLRALLSAETTFQNTVGKGEYGGLKELHDAGLIDTELSRGLKGGYRFTIVTKKSTLTTHPAVDLVARPVEYGTNARRSFYLTEAGVLLTSEVKNAPLASMKPFAQGGDGGKTVAAKKTVTTPTDDFDEEGMAREIASNESAAQVTLGAIYAAQMKYSFREGAGAYGTLEELVKVGLLDKELNDGTQHGYVFDVKTAIGKAGAPPTFTISAVPETYGGTGRISYFIDQTGIVRGGEKEGGPADASDPPIEN